ncbi:hypothetical protein Acr_00g0073970 [Actinidia rufa]|uniref:Uncharacterized protein n=1 Tax=Actinidia rufa TaxID=165716 RepID=A0A7J0DSE7_9ERIC|nr:hypothetical protein Acr_00g0073970 [Actinidia rufa]
MDSPSQKRRDGPFALATDKQSMSGRRCYFISSVHSATSSKFSLVADKQSAASNEQSVHLPLPASDSSLQKILLSVAKNEAPLFSLEVGLESLVGMLPRVQDLLIGMQWVFFIVQDVTLQLLERRIYPCDPAVFLIFLTNDTFNSATGCPENIPSHYISGCSRVLDSPIPVFLNDKRLVVNLLPLLVSPVAGLALICHGAFELVLTICFYFQNMALNWAQLLAHDNESLARFRVDHRIPNNVVIERPGPNNDADWVEGEGDRVPIRTWFIHQVVLRFPLSSMLASGGDLIVVQLRSGHPILPPFRIREQAPRTRSSLLDEVSDLFEGTSIEFRRLMKEAEGESSGPNESSSSSWDIDFGDKGGDDEAEVEDGEEVDQIPVTAPLVPILAAVPPTQPPAVEPIIILSSNFDTADELSNKRGNSQQRGLLVRRRGVSTSLCLKQHTVDLKKANQKAHGLEKELKQTRAELSDARNAVFDHAFERAGDVYKKQLVELYPVWLPAPLEGYSPIILPDFNEEEYATLLANEEGVDVAAAKGRDPAGVERTIAEGVEGARGAKDEGENLLEGYKKGSFGFSTTGFRALFELS